MTKISFAQANAKPTSWTLEEINIKSHRGKRLRGELLVLLKDLSGMKYLEIIEIPMFSNLSLNSLPKLYQDAKKRQEASEESI